MPRRKKADALLVNLSSEQQRFVDDALEGKNILVDACIGSGKTTAIQQLCNVYPSDKRILYLTYNRLLKNDAKTKIKKKNVTVTNYHGFAYSCLIRIGLKAGISDLIQHFNTVRPPVRHYDVLIIDEYQDIELELAQMLDYIKYRNPGMQIIAVGDMQQKIYDKTTLDVPSFINNFLEEYELLEFTKCFRLSAGLAEMLGRVWKKKIVGVNKDCRIEMMGESEVVRFLAVQKPADILCLGSRTGPMSRTLNSLERLYPETFNKQTVYASIADNDSIGSVDPGKDTAIFTTYDSSKGLERKICVVFDFMESYWVTRLEKPQQSYEILRNIFCVAASRGKSLIIFVKPRDSREEMLSERSLSTDTMEDHLFGDMDISEMFDFKYKEDVEECYKLLHIKEIPREDHSVIKVNENDALIDLSPCIGTYQEAMFFKNYNIERAIEQYFLINHDQKFLYTEDIQKSSLEYKILFLTSLETQQNRYRTQVKLPYITEKAKDEITARLGTVLSPEEKVQISCSIPFEGPKGEKFSARGRCDAIKNDIVYELKFVSELQHEHFLQCACYIISLGLQQGILWNVRDNRMCLVEVPDQSRFLDAVVRAITKGKWKNYIEGKRYIFRPSAQEPKASEPISKPRIVTNLAPKIHKNVSEPKPALSPVRRSVPSRKEEDQQLSFVFEPSDSGGWDIKLGQV